MEHSVGRERMETTAPDLGLKIAKRSLGIYRKSTFDCIFLFWSLQLYFSHENVFKKLHSVLLHCCFRELRPIVPNFSSTHSATATTSGESTWESLLILRLLLNFGLFGTEGHITHKKWTWFLWFQKSQWFFRDFGDFCVIFLLFFWDFCHFSVIFVIFLWFFYDFSMIFSKSVQDFFEWYAPRLEPQRIL